MTDHELAQLINDARDWLADAYPTRDFSGASENSVYRLVDQGYDGGWDAFVSDNGVHVYLVDETFAAVMIKARTWLDNAFPGAEYGTRLTKSEVRRMVERHYASGWDSFVADTMAVSA